MKLSEMAKTAVPCPKCGLKITGNHYWYKGGWKCKSGANAGAATPAATTPPAAAPTTPAPAKATKPAAGMPTSNIATAAKEKPLPKPTIPPAPAHQPPPGGYASPYEDPEYQQKLKRWLDHHEVSDYTIDESGVSVNGDVIVATNDRPQIPVKFNKVTGDFLWPVGALTTLKNSPIEVGGDYEVTTTVSDFAPSFEGGPRKVGGIYSVSANVSSIEGLPEQAKVVTIGSAKLTSLAGIHKQLKRITGTGGRSQIKITAPLTSSVLGLMMIPGVVAVELSAKGGEPELGANLRKVVEIINRHLSSEDRDAFMCMDELIEAGLNEYAKL